MGWTLTDSIEEYLASAGDYLRSRPVEHTVELAAAETLRVRGRAAFGREAPLLGWCRSPAGDIVATVFHTPPFLPLLGGLQAAIGPLAQELAARRRPLAGVHGEVSLARSFAGAWRELTGAAATVRRRSRLLRLGDLVAPSPGPAGRARVASGADTDLLVRWLAEFAAETDDVHDDSAAGIADRLSYGGLTLWEVDGRPVALAGHNRPAAGVVRVGPVFTPRDQRRRGYGGAATAAVSQAALETGATVVLFTDLGNPTSSALYPRLGYRPVGDRVVLAFGPATCS
jgi:hypothetical protein